MTRVQAYRIVMVKGTKYGKNDWYVDIQVGHRGRQAQLSKAKRKALIKYLSD